MNFFETLSTAFYTIIENKLRTILTMIGIIIGVGAVIMILSLGNGFKNSIKKDLDQLDLDQFTIMSRYSENKKRISCFLDMEDVELIKKNKKVDVVSPLYSITSEKNTKTFNNSLISVVINGITVEYHKLKSKENLLYGRHISNIDVKNKVYVAEISNIDAKKIFGYENVVGKKIKLETHESKKIFTIVGVYENKNKNNFDFYQVSDNINIYVPITCVQDIENKNIVDNINIKVRDKDEIKEISENIVKLLKIKNKEADYETFVMAEFIEDVNKVITIFSLFLSFVASISLLVGGIGIMNIMLVSVTERTKEIGIRKSLGATNLNIKIQFLIESIVISIIGGILGITLGYIGSIFTSNIINKFLQTEIVPFINLYNVLIITLISLFIGIVFGVYPSVKASKLDPIEALMYE